MKYQYKKRNFSSETQEILKKEGFRVRRNLWYRIYGEGLFQMVAINRAPFPQIVFSSDLTFCPFFDEDAIPYDGIEFPSQTLVNANWIYGGMHAIELLAPELRFEFNEPYAGEQAEELAAALVRDIVLPNLNQCRTIEEDFRISRELGYYAAKYYRPWQNADSFDIVNSPFFTDKLLYELCYLHRFGECADYIRRRRAVVEAEGIRSIRNGAEIPLEEWLHHANSLYQNLLNAVDAGDIEQLDKIFHENHDRFINKFAIKLNLSQELFPYSSSFNQQ